MAIDTGILNSQDKLYIYDGPNANSTALSGTGPYLFGKVAGLAGLGPVVLTSSGQDLFLRFTSDWYYTAPGFAITYEQGKSKATCFKKDNVAISTPHSARLIKIANNLIVPDTIIGAPTVDPCGNEKPLIIDNTTHGNITSPNYPNNYPANVDCQWEIHAHYGEAVVLTLHDIKTEFG